MAIIGGTGKLQNSIEAGMMTYSGGAIVSWASPERVGGGGGTTGAPPTPG